MGYSAIKLVPTSATQLGSQVNYSFKF